jgi:hypothetical protein
MTTFRKFGQGLLFLVPIGVLFVIVAFASWGAALDPDVNYLAATGIEERDGFKSYQYWVDVASATAILEPIYVGGKSVARVQIFNGSQTAGGQYATTGASNATVWFEGKPGTYAGSIAFTSAAYYYPASAPNKATIEGITTTPLTTFGMWKVDVSGMAYMRVHFIANGTSSKVVAIGVE